MTRVFKGFRTSDDGSATIETVIWLPFLILFFVFTAEVSNVLFTKTKMEQIVTDANRMFSVGVFQDTTELDTFVLAQLADISADATYTSSVGSQMITSLAVVPVSDVLITSFYGSWFDFKISASSTQYVEY
ncbi:TadE/TadG family type IV pilus assembly protein [Celeribacter litoreus]|uniref:TadE/TadG family type IV pilus assembly protein n=1 Tax=Celeribacter litoreus TaxID=2876714 RepID=UPI001CCF3912|nr:TadE/TadG family type IV pilus assembly protein [Celeribacter litoreus]MCA0042662.1 pilus assembly protein [Celeribacter litoreus]